MTTFEKLSVKEKAALLKFPAYISILAANNDGILDEVEAHHSVIVDFILPLPVPGLT